MPLAAVLVVVSTAIAVGVLVFSRMGTGGGSGGGMVFEQRNVEFRYPVPNWEKDDEAKSLLAVNLFGLKRTDGTARVAMDARDYQTRNPQPGELAEAVREKLKPLFEDLDLTEQPGAKLAGVPSQRWSFRGNAGQKLGHGVFVGEADAMASKGVGYLFFALCPETEAAVLNATLDDIRQRVQLLNMRENWTETTARTPPLVGQDADYQLTDGDGWWKKQQDATIEDPKADTLYDAVFKSKAKRDAPPKARVAVLLLDAGDDPVVTLRGYLRGRYEEFGLKNWEELKDPPLGDGPVAGGPPGDTPVHRFKVSGPDANTATLVVVSAVKTTAHAGGKPVVAGVHAACSFDVQGVWEKRLVYLAASLRGSQ